MTIINVIHDLFLPFFRNLASWGAWFVALKAIFGLEMTGEEVPVYQRHTGRQCPPTRQVLEAVLEVGRRGGKSRIAALIAVFLACFRDYADLLSPGERGTVMVIAADHKQARTVLRYIVAFLEGVPMLAALIERKTAETIDLTNGITIEVHSGNFRSVRGYTVVCCICDEIAYWRNEESANPDVEIVNAVRPAMATVPGALLVMITTLYSPHGLVGQMHRGNYGKEDEGVLIWNSDTLSMNPTVNPAIIARAFEEDEAAAWSEYGRDGEIRFRSDIESFVSRTAVNACVVLGRVELPPMAGVSYSAFVDPSGGSADSFTLAISHNKDGKGILDCVRERKPPFSPERVVAEFAGTLKSYRCAEATSDSYAAEWPREQFRKNGIECRMSTKTKSEIYLELLPGLNSGRVELLDNDRLVAQLTRLERRTGRSGKDSIDHPPNSHDDLANAAAGALVLVSAAQCQPGFCFVGMDRFDEKRFLAGE